MEYLSDHVHLSDDGTAVVILDQTQLPNRTQYLTLRTPQDMFHAIQTCLLYTSPSPRDRQKSRMPSSA